MTALIAGCEQQSARLATQAPLPRPRKQRKTDLAPETAAMQGQTRQTEQIGDTAAAADSNVAGTDDGVQTAHAAPGPAAVAAAHEDSALAAPSVSVHDDSKTDVCPFKPNPFLSRHGRQILHIRFYALHASAQCLLCGSHPHVVRVRAQRDELILLLIASCMWQGSSAADAAAVRGVLDDCLEHVCVVDDPPQPPPPPSVPRPPRAVSLLLQALLGKPPPSQARLCPLGYSRFWLDDPRF